MRLLFVHRRFPGQFLHLVRSLAGQAAHQVVFISERPADSQGAAPLPGVTHAAYATPPSSRRTHPAAQAFDEAQRRAQAVAEVAAGLRAAGFQPDIIIGHEAWGELLNLADIWPDVPTIAYREYFYHLDGADVGFDPEFPVAPAQRPAIRAKNAVGLLGLMQPHQGVTPTAWQRSLYPAWAQPAIAVVPDGVDLATCRPDPDAQQAAFALGTVRVPQGARLLTFVARDLEPYRGFHTLMRALPRVMAHAGTHVVCVGGDGVSYGLLPAQGSWRQRLLAEVGHACDPARLHFPGRIGYGDYLRLLQRSDVHAYLSYPFIPSWSLREALACGCALVAGDTAPVREFIDHGVNGVLAPCLDAQAVADAVLRLFDDAPLRRALSHAARARAVREFGLDGHLAAWAAVINRTSQAAGA